MLLIVNNNNVIIEITELVDVQPVSGRADEIRNYADLMRKMTKEDIKYLCNQQFGVNINIIDDKLIDGER